MNRSALHSRQPRQSRGFSLVELLVASTLGLILLSGMVTVFSGNQRSSELNTALANIQESARYALDAMSRDVRNAGHQGCLNVNNGSFSDGAPGSTPRSATVAPSTHLNQTATMASIIQSQGNWVPNPPTGFVLPTPVPARVGSHALTLQFGSTDTRQLTQQMRVGVASSPAGPVLAAGEAFVVPGDLALISDCNTADLFRVTGAVQVGLNPTVWQLSHAAGDNDSANLRKAFGAPANLAQTKVMKFESKTYYVGDTGLTNSDGDPIYSLYLQTLPFGDPDNPPVELVQGVENMRVAFGLRVSPTTLRYVHPDDPAYNPAQVESIRIGVLMASWDQVTQQEDLNTYVLAGQTIPAASGSSDANTHAADKRFRLVFNTTVKVRNRRSN